MSGFFKRDFGGGEILSFPGEILKRQCPGIFPIHNHDRAQDPQFSN